MNINQETLVNYLKNYGFVYPNSEIYNGLANAWDYGPLGAVLKNNLKQELLKFFVFSQPNMSLVDTSIILNSSVWQASGHITNFSDPLVDCKKCKSRFRADKLLETYGVNVAENTPNEAIENQLIQKQVACPNCKSQEWTKVRKFNLMFKTFQGVTEDNLNTLYLRPETAQGIFVNFKNIIRTQRYQLPFGVAQIGKAFRNEITPGNFIFRTREFEQMEIEYFVNEKDALNVFDSFKDRISYFLLNVLQIKKENLKIHEHPQDELSHYSKKTIDFEFNFPHGFGELWGLAYRGDYDLNAHENLSKKNLKYRDFQTNEEFLPHVIEPSVGIERLFYALVANSYCIETLANNDTREVLKVPKRLAPYEIAVLPLINKLSQKAQEIFNHLLNRGFRTTFDSSGTIGKRYRRMDAIGTPYCLTIDFDTLEKQTVTIRDRDSMQQETIPLDKIVETLIKKIRE